MAKVIHPMNGVLPASSAPESFAESNACRNMAATAFLGTNPPEMPLLMRKSAFTADY